MKFIPVTHELITNMKDFYRTTISSDSYRGEEPIRAQLLSASQMETFGKSLAGRHTLSTKPAEDHLLTRLADSEKLLTEVRKLLTGSIKEKHRVTPAGEWLIDNFYLIEEHIRIAKLHFPKKYSEDLPQLLEDTSGRLTRIYDIAVQIISHSDGRINIEILGSFVKAYQTVTNLKLGELWAIPLMLRLALIENIRRIAARVAIDMIDGKLADYWAKQMIEKAEDDPKNLLLVIADMSRSNPPIVSVFVSELTRQLRGKGPGLALALNWIEQQLSERGLTSNELINAENQKQAADQVSISNSIGSLRLLGTMDWRNFVESNSSVEQTLREDNGGIYGSMDFTTRDRYRHVVEHIAKKSKITEHEVACIAIQLMHENTLKNNTDDRTSHVGYYLIDQGVGQTKKRAKMRVSAFESVRLAFKKHTLKVYLGAIFLITLVTSAAILARAYSDTQNTWFLLAIAILLLLSISQLAIAVVNFFSTLLTKPHLLPRMDFSKEIPSEFRTLVVIPAILNNIEVIEKLIESLEIRFLANRNTNLHFGLITDFADAAEETLPEDQALVDLVQQKIEGLNKKYKREESDLFYLFHRPRFWNPEEDAWMGYERKRGKLSELNSLLRGSSKDRFSLIIGNQSIFTQIKYVITLDADTQLPLESAWKLIGTMAHPLNHAWYNEKKQRVTKGYGILQPRVTVSLPDKTSSIYTRLHGNEPGMDPYTRASSDVYQDLFAEGSFIGKGIYEVDTFIKVLDGRFSENTVLSHDLLEGCYLRSGLISDVQLFEKYPASYHSDMHRYARWIRGDWQIFSWFLPFVPGIGKHWHKNPISALSRWKIFDNIRRSLVPAALTTLILIGWIVLASSLFWTLIVSGIIVAPIFITSVWEAIRKPKGVILSHHLKNSVRSIADIFFKTLFTLICLPWEAFSNLKAISISLWRMAITRKKLLEWNQSSNVEMTTHSTLSTSYTAMWIEPILASVVFIFLSIDSPEELIIAGPILLLWLLAPTITWWTSKPLPKEASVLTGGQNIFLHKMARKTWSFFEHFVGQEDNWLPPDNFQEQPVVLIAHRTSPTNIGLSLLANVSAHDFGYITTGQFLERTENTISTMKKMERYKGHFYNWYDTKTLAPLLPKYISTVDSGNLVGHLLILKQGLLDIPRQSILGVKLFQGLRDTLLALTDTLDKKDIPLLQQFETDMDAANNDDSNTFQGIKLHLDGLTKSFASIFEKLSNDTESETYWWKQTLREQLEQVNEAFQIFSPWLLMTSAPPKFAELVSVNVNSTLIELLKAARTLQDEATLQKTVRNTADENEWLQLLFNALTESIDKAQGQITTAENLARQCKQLADVEWDFLYDRSSNLFTIGYSVQEHRMDASFYDLLASEARLCTYIGIAQGKLPEESWFALGRLLTNMNGHSVLLSWSGSMFEYLMPLLVMPTFENTLLDQTYKSVVNCQILYGKQTGRPWGISESGYNMINADSQYQYRAFGYPGLGLKRGLDEDAVIAPYASAMALMVVPEKACENLELLSEKGFEGRYGFYEAIDYTPSRLPRGKSSAIVYSFMSHHQGMSLLSFAYLLLDKPMQKLFELDPQFKAIHLLLQERIPKTTAFFAHTTDIEDVNLVESAAVTRIINTPNTAIPEVQLLSNGNYHVMITNSGAGYSRWRDIAVTRWREDVTCDNWGAFCYIQDSETGEYWSNTHQPTAKKAENYEAVFSLGRVDFHTTHNEIETHTEIVVSPEDDIEMRRVCISNFSKKRRTIVVTSYAEVVIAPAASDVSQPAFSNLFVQTEILPVQHAILCTRRPKSVEEKLPWMFHMISIEGKDIEEISYETDRMKFIGRGNTIVNPAGHEQFRSPIRNSRFSTGSNCSHSV